MQTAVKVQKVSDAELVTFELHSSLYDRPALYCTCEPGWIPCRAVTSTDTGDEQKITKAHTCESVLSSDKSHTHESGAFSHDRHTADPNSAAS